MRQLSEQTHYAHSPCKLTIGGRVLNDRRAGTQQSAGGTPPYPSAGGTLSGKRSVQTHRAKSSVQTLRANSLCTTLRAKSSPCKNSPVWSWGKERSRAGLNHGTNQPSRVGEGAISRGVWLYGPTTLIRAISAWEGSAKGTILAISAPEGSARSKQSSKRSSHLARGLSWRSRAFFFFFLTCKVCELYYGSSVFIALFYTYMQS
jgi:hypothetical protein